MGAFTLDDWNRHYPAGQRPAQNPPDGCDPVDTLEEAEAPHKWSKDDIQQVQDKLTEICKDNSFSDIPDLWKQDTIDEINDAIANGWCECNEDCDDTQGPILWKTMPAQTGVGGVIFSFCPGVDGGDPCPGYTPRIKAFRNDLMPPGTRISRAGINGRFWRLAGVVTYWNGKTDAVMGPSGRVACDGTVEPQDDDTWYWGAHFETMAYCWCNNGEFTFDPEPMETKLEYFLYISGGDSPCGPHPGCKEKKS